MTKLNCSHLLMMALFVLATIGCNDDEDNAKEVAVHDSLFEEDGEFCIHDRFYSGIGSYMQWQHARRFETTALNGNATISTIELPFRNSDSTAASYTISIVEQADDKLPGKQIGNDFLFTHTTNITDILTLTPPIDIELEPNKVYYLVIGAGETGHNTTLPQGRWHTGCEDSGHKRFFRTNEDEEWIALDEDFAAFKVTVTPL